MTQKTWIGGTIGSFIASGSWSPSGVPGSLDTVVIAGPGTDVEYNSTLSSTINSVSLSSGVTLTIEGTSPNTAIFTIANVGTSSVNDGLIDVIGGGQLLLTGSIFQTGTIAAVGTNTMIQLESADIAGGTLSATSIVGQTSTLDGTTSALVLQGTLSAVAASQETESFVNAVSDGAVLSLLGTIANQGVIDLRGTAGTVLIGDARVGDVTLTGGGLIGLDAATDVIAPGGSAATLVDTDNQISGEGTIGALSFTIDAAGRVEAIGGILTLATGSLAITNTGLLSAVGNGTLVVSGTVSGPGEIESGVFGSIDLQSADLIGQDLKGGGGGLISPLGATTLDGVTIDDAALAAGDFVDIDLRNTVTNTGTILLDGTTYAAQLLIDTPVVTLTGGGTIALVHGVTAQEIGAGIAGATLDNVDNLIEGGGQIGGGTGLALANGGTIAATDLLGGLTLDLVSPVINTGLIEATTSLGLTLAGTIDNQGGTIAAASAVAIVSVLGADIVGGTLAGGPGTIQAAGATLDGVSNSGSLLLAIGDTLHLRDDFAIVGQLAVSGGALSIDTPVVTLSGGGTIAVGGIAVIETGVAAATLYNVDNLITGAGTIGGGTSLALINAGTIDASDTASALTIDGIGGVTNAGLLEATGAGGLQFTSGTTIANVGGLVLAAGSQITLSGLTIAGGTLATSGGGRLLAAGATLDGRSDGPISVIGGVDISSDTLALSGTIAGLGSLAVAGTAALRIGVIAGDDVVLGGGTIILTAGRIVAGGTAETLTDLAATIIGSGSIDGAIAITLGAAGVIGAAGGMLTLDQATAVLNAGSVQASPGGTLVLGGTVSGGVLGANGGLLQLAGADLIGATLAADPTPIQVIAASTLDGSATAFANLATIAITAAQSLTALGSIANSGLVQVTDAGGTLRIGNATTFSGGGLIVLGTADRVSAVGVASLLDNADNSFLGAGSLGLGAVSLFNEAGGTIAATTGPMVLDPGAAGTIANAGLIEADGFSLQIASGRLLSTGTLAALDATLSATGATPPGVAGTLATGIWLAASTTAATTLALGGVAITDDAADIILSGTSAALLAGTAALSLSLAQIDAGGTLDLRQGQSFLTANTLVNYGTVLLTQATLAANGGGTLVNDGFLAGAGAVTAPIQANGTIAAAGGALSLGPVGGAGTMLVEAGADMILTGVAGGGTVTFGGASGTLTIDQAASFSDVIAGFSPGDIIDLANTGAIHNVTYDPASGLLSVFVSQAIATGPAPTVTAAASLTLAGTFTQSQFAVRTDPGGYGTSIDFPCFAAGTRILTAKGEVVVEHLRAGDLLPTRDGLRPIVWIGHRGVDCRRHPEPSLVWPVCIDANAFADNYPTRRLFLSPDHAVFIDGVLLPIRHLINGNSIARVEADEVEYWHVELDRHDVLFAEGLPCESYLDTGNRSAFANGAAHIDLHPDFTARSWNDACAELVQDGPRLVAVKKRLFLRAGIHSVQPALALRVLAETCELVPDIPAPGVWRFAIPPATRALHLVSPGWIPAEHDAASLDRRTLGVRLFGVTVDGRAIELDGPALFSGFHSTEHTAEGACRWTTGDARLVLPVGGDVVTLYVGEAVIPEPARLAPAA